LPVCGAHPTVTELIDYQAFCGIGRLPSYDVRRSPRKTCAIVAGKPRSAAGPTAEPHEYEIATSNGAC